jgi:hypothetical protein
MTTIATPTTATPSNFLQWLEGDVIALIQDIEGGLTVVANDITSALSWLGSHIGDIAATVTAVQSVETQLNAAGVPIPPALASGITAINNAVAGVDSALTGQAIAANAGQALTVGYQAAKVLQIAAAGAAQLAANIATVTPPTTAASTTAATAASS